MARNVQITLLGILVGSKESFLYNRSLQCNAPLGVMLWGGGGGGGGGGRRGQSKFDQYSLEMPP